MPKKVSRHNPQLYVRQNSCPQCNSWVCRHWYSRAQECCAAKKNISRNTPKYSTRCAHYFSLLLSVFPIFYCLWCKHGARNIPWECTALPNAECSGKHEWALQSFPVRRTRWLCEFVCSSCIQDIPGRLEHPRCGLSTVVSNISLEHMNLT